MVFIVLFSLLMFLSCTGMEESDKRNWREDFYALGEKLINKHNIPVTPENRNDTIIHVTLCTLSNYASDAVSRRKEHDSHYCTLLDQTLDFHPEWIHRINGSCSSPLYKMVARICHRDRPYWRLDLLRWIEFVNHAESATGNSCLHALASEDVIRKIDRLELFDLLVSKGADQNITNKYGDTPLHYAALNRSCSFLVKKLLAMKNTDINKLNKKSQTALDLALLFKKTENASTNRKAIRRIVLLENHGALTGSAILRNNHSMQSL